MSESLLLCMFQFETLYVAAGMLDIKDARFFNTTLSFEAAHRGSDVDPLESVVDEAIDYATLSLEVEDLKHSKQFSESMGDENYVTPDSSEVAEEHSITLSEVIIEENSTRSDDIIDCETMMTGMSPFKIQG